MNLKDCTSILILSKAAILEALHTLIDESGVPIIISGFDGISNLLSNLPENYNWLEETFATRFGSLQMNPLTYNNEYVRLLITLHNDCKLEPTKEPFFSDKLLCQDILTYTNGLLGKIIVLIKECARYIYRYKKKSNPPLTEDITPDLIDKVAINLNNCGWDLNNTQSTEGGSDGNKK